MNRTHKNFGYTSGGGNPGDGSTDWTGSRPRNNIANDFTEQYKQALGQVRIGRVTEVYAAAKLCEVNCGTGLLPATWVGQVSNFLGCSDLHMPTPGEIVILYKPESGFAYILGSIPWLGDSGGIYDTEFSGIDAFSEDRHSFILQPDALGISYYNNSRPFDTLPGDKGWIDSFGGVIGLFQGFALLKAAQLAQIQCFHIDDLVRVISRNYQHWHAAGETRIFDDEGELNLEFLFSKKSTEAFGEDEQADISEDDDGDDTQFKKLKDEDKVLKDRLKLHIGHNGDLIHLWVTKPTKGDGKLSESQSGAGLAEIYIGPDGTIKVNTTKEVIIGKKEKLLVPKRAKEPWDDEGDSTDSGYEPDTNFKDDFKWDESNKDGKALQESDKLIYDNRKHVRKYKDHEKDFHELKEETPEPEEGENDYEETTAVIHLREDGSIYLEDTEHSSFELTGTGDIRVACPKDYFVEAGRDINFFAGRSINQRAKKNIEFCSTEESLRLKAQKGSGLRIQCCHELWCRLQLGSHVVVAVV